MLNLKKKKFSFVSLGFSDLPAPVAAPLDPDSPTKELDSILDDLMGLAQGVSTASACACSKMIENYQY